MIRACKKWISAGVLASLLVSNATTASASYADTQKHWAADAIGKWTSKGVISGGTNGLFEPNRSITRAEFVSLLSRVFKYTDTSDRAFPDVPEKAWYADAVSKAAAAGILSGDEQGRLRPEAPVSRQEAASILYRAFRLEVRDPARVATFKDADRIAAWGRDAVSALVEGGYVSGRPGGGFAPDDFMTRAEAVRMLDALAGELKNAAGTYTGDVSTNLVVNAGDVILRDMKIAANLYLAEGIGDGNVTLDNVTVNGQTVIRGGGDHSILLIDSAMNGKVTILKKDGKIRIVSEGTTQVSDVALGSGAILEGDFEEVSVEAPGVSVRITGGTIGNVILKGRDSMLQIGEEATVTRLAAQAKTTVTGQGKIESAQIDADGVTIEQKPGTTTVSPRITASIGGAEVAGGESGTTVGAANPPAGGNPPSTSQPQDPSTTAPSGPSSNTGIAVKAGQEAAVKGIWPGTIQVPYSTNVGQLLAAVRSVDGSSQTYEIYGGTGGTKLNSNTAVLMTSNVLKVTAANGAATAEYRIIVNPVGDRFVLTPVATTAGSQSTVSKAVYATDNSGMSGYEGIRDSHGNDAGSSMWRTGNNPGSHNWIQVDLGAVYPLGNMLIWNYNEPGKTNSGIKNARVLYSADGTTWTTLGGAGATKQFAQATGSAAEKAGTTVDFGGAAARYVKIVPNAAPGDGNWGANGPTTFGLGELRFYLYAPRVTAAGEQIAVLDVLAGSVNSADTPALNAVNNYGMSSVSGASDTHGNAGATMWLSAVNPGAGNWIQFDLGGTYPLSAMHVWNYNANSGEYGIKNAQVQYSVDGRTWTTLGSYQFAKAGGSAAQGPTDLVGGGAVQFQAASARYVKIVPNAAAGDGNWGSQAAFGLSEVRFYSAPGTIVEPQRDWTSLVTRTSGWTGSDGIFTIPYNGYDAPGQAEATKTLFLFSDTFVGSVNPVSKFRNVADFTNNTLGVLTGGDPDPDKMDFIWSTDGNGQTTSGLFVPNTPQSPDDAWYWLQDGLYLNGNIYISSMNVVPDPLQPPGWQFRVASVSMIKVPLVSGELDLEHQTQYDTSLLYHTEFQWGTKEDGSPNMLSQEHQFGAGFMTNTAEAGAPAPDDYVYVYGYQTVFGVRGLLVARVLPADFEDESKWEFKSGSGWTHDISQAAVISHSSVDVSPELSVTPIIGGPNNGKYRLVYSTGLFSADHGLIKESIGDTPWGPFGPAKTLYYTTEDKSSAAETYIYNAKAHPNISNPGELLISYNVNSTQDGGNVHFNNGDLYHPRFLVMRRITVGSASSGTDIGITAENGVEGLTNGTILVNEGTTAASVTGAVYAEDGSFQTYEIFAAGGGGLLTGTTPVPNGSILKVTAEDQVTTRQYSINVLDPLFVRGVVVTAGSEESVFGMTASASNVVDSSGMSGVGGGKQDAHDRDFAHMWLTSDDTDEDNNWIRFDLGSVRSLGEMWVWNYNEDDGTGWLKNGNGLQYAAVEYSTDGVNWTTLGGDGYRYRFAKAANGTSVLASTNLVGGGVVDFGGADARYVRITPNGATDPSQPGNYGGVFEGAFGVKSTFGISEVRFYEASPDL